MQFFKTFTTVVLACAVGVSALPAGRDALVARDDGTVTKVLGVAALAAEQLTGINFLKYVPGIGSKRDTSGQVTASQAIDALKQTNAGEDAIEAAQQNPDAFAQLVNMYVKMAGQNTQSQ